jgi:CHAT domain-containing protein
MHMRHILWNVSDQATGEFVKAFYQKLAATQDVTLSFHHAQDQLRAKYPHPYYWAAFYLSQAS